MSDMTNKKLPSYGGQALIEGVLMRGMNHVVASFRAPDGHIEVVHEELTGIYKSKIRRIPLLRGLVVLWDSLGLGLHFLTISANVQTGEDEKLDKKDMVLTMIVSFAIAILLFFLGPAWIAQIIENHTKMSITASSFLEGFLRLAVVVGYMWIVSKMEDVNRVFRYHGAEHKTINCFEKGLEVNLENVRGQSRHHPRCGTAFMVTVVIISVILFILISPLTPNMASRLISRLLLVPVIAGVSYEFIRWTAAHLNNPFVKILVKPNMWVQNITTAVPDDSMLECAINSFNLLLAYENNEPIPDNVIQPKAEQHQEIGDQKIS